MTKDKAVLLLITISSLTFSCTKFVQVDSPKNQLTVDNVFLTEASTNSAVTGIYTTMMNGTLGFGAIAVSEMLGLSSDEFINESSDQFLAEFANSKISVTNADLLEHLWSEPYLYIFSANSVLDGVRSSKSLTDSFKIQMEAEAKFIRAFCYFYLTNLYGDVPMYLTTDYQTNAVSTRASSSIVYAQIIADLKDAQTGLLNDYSASGGQRVRPNRSAATALLARVYLYQQKWDSAEAEATSVINNNSLYNLTSLDSVFLANSNEAIWQLLPVIPNINTVEGYTFILTAEPTTVSLDSFVVKAFEPGDARLTNWVGTFSDGTNTWNFPYKYKVQASATLTEYSMVIRLAEMYLIRAEARAQQMEFSGSESDLNMIRNRASLSNTTASDQPSLLLAIEHERQVELFTEWGHRWLDLKRTGRADAVLSAEKPTWISNAILFPIPSAEIQSNPKITQNPGY
ncbi:MAG TPA: RagB/SusD family nutrient uptake outer membrane protein [Puia sp.]|nr:RagB/SusD family nutrient uptake outer membrane protein [Puia sp.]